MHTTWILAVNVSRITAAAHKRTHREAACLTRILEMASMPVAHMIWVFTIHVSAISREQ